MKQLENIAIKVDSKDQWEQVASVLEGYGFRKSHIHIYADWDFRLSFKMENNYVVNAPNGINLWGREPKFKTQYTFTDFMQKFGQPQPDPIAEFAKRLEALEAMVFGSNEWPKVEIGSDSINIKPYEPVIQTLPFIVPAPEQASDKSFFEHKNLTAPNQFGNYHRFTDEQGNEFEAPTEVCDKRICIDHLTGKRQLVQVVEVDEEQPEPQPAPVYDGVFWFSLNGRTRCINGKHAMSYSVFHDAWLILSSEDLPKQTHRLVPVDEFTVGKWYACEAQDLNTPYGYSMYLADGRFISWTARDEAPILIHNESDCYVQPLEVQPA